MSYLVYAWLSSIFAGASVLVGKKRDYPLCTYSPIPKGIVIASTSIVIANGK